MLTMESLKNCFVSAKDLMSKYVAVRIAIGLSKEEVIINPRENFDEKLAYYQHAYDEGLRHKFSGDQDIRITGFAFGDTYGELEFALEVKDLHGTSLN